MTATTANRVLRDAMEELSKLRWVDQATAAGLANSAEALTNMCVVLVYQGATGAATESDFDQATEELRQALAT